ncbi:cell division protein FtsL [Parabacteroides sp. PF5-5]|uniref:hypothetical protein n=1 Tax=unclassified Parabacteroides TaxID=2649774 RepID=UPI0024748977|nr:MULTISPECIES: hypothetical protein [unclassified Parabacteroides]MDH6306695.1 cell division protein FtsL [Parabacteroides sp. PH5-39]MDH6317909.1 cell division protein FtsL [Parabacteroides sp. PF5-13]MDH6321453.1 cell division protein FtsL [Parabacteroides sp. PH5-13]MDH6325184.1 cell division protein FtsL [Parabacteroides sp. PH5-8]MDH6329058.1 cell division protein FtsL [Parabacteroides sp. PH5-41]
MAKETNGNTDIDNQASSKDEGMINKKTRKNVILYACLCPVVISFTICIIFVKGNFYSQMKPELEKLNKRIEVVEETNNIDSLSSVLYERFLIDRRTTNVNVGISALLKGNDITIYSDANISKESNLKNGDILYLTNHPNTFKPTIEVKVNIVDRLGNESAADLFVSPEAADILGIKEEMRPLGIFKMSIREINKR